jgi:hypothetical protein
MLPRQPAAAFFLIPNSSTDQCFFYQFLYFHSARFVNHIMVLPNFASVTARVSIFIRELRTDASLLSLIASGFSTLAVRIANQLFTAAGQPCKTDPLIQTQYLNKIIHDLI